MTRTRLCLIHTGGELTLNPEAAEAAKLLVPPMLQAL
jgi:hypothetical protein